MAESTARRLLRLKTKRVCIKAGTAVVAHENGRPSLTRLGAIAEQIAELHERGIEVILVSTGSVGMGKRLLRNQQRMHMRLKDIQAGEIPEGSSARSAPGRNRSFIELLDTSGRPHTMAEKATFYDSACAAAGQFEMMNLYSSLFNQCDVAASQILVTQSDFTDPKGLQNLKYSIERLLALGIVPIINENDAVSANLGYTADDLFSDNDSLASLCARSFDADALILLTDVEGVFDKPPAEPGAQKIDLYIGDFTEIATGDKGSYGRGGMGAKIDAATSAVAEGSNCEACIIASGSDLNSIRAILGPEPRFEAKGTLFLTPCSEIEKQTIEELDVAKVRLENHKSS